MTSTKNTKSGIYGFLSIVLVLINSAISYILAGGLAGANVSQVMGEVVGGAILFPLIVVGLVSISKKMRNNRSQAKAFFWTSLVLMLSNISRFISLAAIVAENSGN